MRKTGMLLLQLFLSAALVWPMMARAAQPEHFESERLTSLLAAIAADSHADFIAGGTPEFAAITPEQFAAVAAQVGPRLRAGYQAEFFGRIRQQGHELSVWKIGFADGGDDFLATMNITDGQTGGFLLR